MTRKHDPQAISTFDYENDPTIKAYTRITISQGCMPTRLVLRRLDTNEWVTHEEVLELHLPAKDAPRKDYPYAIFKHREFHNGHYFGKDEGGFERAQADFKERSKRY